MSTAFEFIPDDVDPKLIDRVIVATAIGSSYFADWYQFAFPSWKRYASHCNAAIIVFRGPVVTPDDKSWKPVRWHKMLAPRLALNHFPRVRQFLVLDSDLLISPIAPDVFSKHDVNRIGVVSSVDVPFERENMLRRLAFLRHHRFSTDYPLDSSLFQSPADHLEQRGFPRFHNLFTAGFFLMNAWTHPQLFADWYADFSTEDAESMHAETGQWEEPFLNAKIQERDLAQWFSYEYQAIWSYEAARSAPVIFDWALSQEHNDDIVRAIEYTLWDCYFLHFAGSWNESQVWKRGLTFADPERLQEVTKYAAYSRQKLLGLPVGKVNPPESQSPATHQRLS